MDLFKRSIYTYLFVTLGVVLISFAMVANGTALPNNPAWGLIKSLRTILLWIAAIPTIIFLITRYLGWLDCENEKHDLERKIEIQELINANTRPILERQYAVKDQIHEINRRLDKIESEQLHAKAVRQKLEVRKNQSAEVVTSDALNEFL
ncbi:MAG: hypothetical protein AB7F59_14780 [Bdellovibrionales bacterium]